MATSEHTPQRWHDALSKALPTLIGAGVGVLTAPTLPEIETIFGSDFTAPYVFVGIFAAIVGLILATVLANLALSSRTLLRRGAHWVSATVAFCSAILAIAMVLSIRAQPSVSEPTAFDVELTTAGRLTYQMRAADQAERMGLDDPVVLAKTCADSIPQLVRTVALGGTVPSPLIVIPSSSIPSRLPCPSVRLRLLGERGVAIPVLGDTQVP